VAYLVQTFVPDACPEYSHVNVTTGRLELGLLPLKHGLSVAAHEVHLVYQDEHASIRTIRRQRLEALFKVLQVLVHLPRLDVKDVNQDADVLEDCGPLRRQVEFHERLLAAAVPEVEYQVPEKPNMVLLHIDGRTQATSERSRVVRAGPQFP
jgi:hypothetical protein